MEEEKKQIYLKLIEAGVTKTFLKENEQFVFEKKLGYKCSKYLSYPMIAELYYEAGYSDDILEGARMYQIFNNALFKIERRLNVFNVDQLIEFFSEDGLKNRRKYIKSMADKNFLDHVGIQILNLPRAIETKLKRTNFSNLSDLVESDSFDLKAVLCENDFKCLNIKMKEAGINFRDSYFMEKKVEDLTDEEKRSLSVKTLFSSNSYISRSLIRANVNTIDDILKLSYNDLIKIKGIGDSSIQKIEKYLNALGFHLREEKCKPKKTVSKVDNSFNSVEILKNKIASKKDIIEEKKDLLLEYRDLLDEYSSLKVEEEILDYQIQCVKDKLSELQIRGKKYERR